MKPTKMLIAALYSAADRIEQGTNYDWAISSMCNCGILAQDLLGKSREEMSDICIDNGIGTWSWAVERDEHFCSSTGLPISEVFKSLHKFGLERMDFDTIEHTGGHSYKDPKFVANFFRQLAVKLEQERKTNKGKTNKGKYESNNETTVDNTKTCLINS